MARRRFPIATVKLHQPGRRYTVQKAAWPFYEDVGSLYKRGALTLTTGTAGQLSVVDGEPSQQLYLAGYCEPVNLMYCTPLWPLDVQFPENPADWWWVSEGLQASVGSLPEIV